HQLHSSLVTPATTAPRTRAPPTPSQVFRLFLFTAPPTPQLYTLSLHDALPISAPVFLDLPASGTTLTAADCARIYSTVAWSCEQDRKSTRLNSSHLGISYAVFCLKKKKPTNPTTSSTHSPMSSPPSLTAPATYH